MTSYRVIYKSPDHGDIDITEGVRQIDKLEHCGTGQIPSAQITLNSKFGRYVTHTNNSGNTPTTPLIEGWSHMKVKVTRKTMSYQKIMIIDNRDLQRASTGKLLILSMQGREQYLKHHKMTGRFIPQISVRDMILDIIRRYNAERKTMEPEITFAADMLTAEAFAVDAFDWGQDGTNMYDALLVCIQSLERPAQNGGVGDYFELQFNDDINDDGKMTCEIFSQGSGATIPELNSDTSLSFLPNRPRSSANMVVCMGAAGKGRLPTDISRYRSLLDLYNNIPPYNLAYAYPKDAYVRYNDVVYQARANLPAGRTPTDLLYWRVITRGDFVGQINYSPWTRHKSTLWKNAGTNPSSTNYAVDKDSPGFLDGNIVVRDTIRRDWADFRVRQISDIDTDYLYGASSTDISKRLYEGLRVLVDPTLGTIIAPFTGSDKFGTPYANGIAQYDRNGDWIVILSAQDNDQCVITSNGYVYEYARSNDPNPRTRRNNTSGTIQWRDISDAYLGRDCVHHPKSITQVDGLTTKYTDPGSEDYYSSNSGIQVVYEVGGIDEATDLLLSVVAKAAGALFDVITNVFTYLFSVDAYNWGWWINFVTPFPFNRKGGIGEGVGALYGGTADSKTPYLDTDNMAKAYDGSEGFTGSGGNSIGPLDGITFFFKFDMRIGGLRFPLTGNLPFEVIEIDGESNVKKATFNYRFLDEVSRITIPLSEFRTYRARTPIGINLSDVIANVTLPELSVQEEFADNKTKRWIIQFADAYDDAGRYNPGQLDLLLKNGFASLIGATVQFIGTVDAFGFTKQPVAIAKGTHTTERLIMENPIQYPNISNTEQLKNIATAELDIAQFERETYTYKDADIVGLNPGQSVYVSDEDVFTSAENANASGTRKLVVDKITYSVTPDGDNGGFVRDIHLLRRINAV